MRSIWKALYLLCIFIFLVISGCADSYIPGSSDGGLLGVDAIDSDDEYIFFVGSTWSNIIFDHLGHSEREDNDCFMCHDHGASVLDSRWKCSACHTVNDPENLCDQDEYHGCIMDQCDFCHEQRSGSAPDAPFMDCTGDPGDIACCLDCHTGGQIAVAGVLLDSAVEGVHYQTNTFLDKTDSKGTFFYMEGETVTFFIADLLLGTTMGGPIRTIVDLVEGATDATHPTVTNICRLLRTLDQDGNPDNGITLTDDIIAEVEGLNIDFEQSIDDFGDDPEVLALIDILNNIPGVFTENIPRDLCSVSDAQRHMNMTLENINASPLVTFPGALKVSGSGGCNAAGCHYQDTSVNGVYQIDEINFPDGILNNKPIYKHETEDYWIHWNSAGDVEEWTLSARTNRDFCRHHYSWSETGGENDYPPLGTWPCGCSKFEGKRLTAIVSPLGGINGNILVGEELTGFYEYFDDEGDPEGGTTFQWYRCDDEYNTNDVQISGANSENYILVDEDEGRYIRFGVTPGTSSGNSHGREFRSGPVGPIIAKTAPIATGIKVELSDISGVNGVYNLDTVNYESAQFNGKPIYKHETENYWIHWNTTGYSNRWAIGDDPNSDQYLYAFISTGNTPPFGWWRNTSSYGSIYYYGGVPVSQNSGINGTYNRIIETGITAPGSTPIGIPGNPWIVGSTITGTYKFYDAESDPEQGSTCQWYRCSDDIDTNDIPISGANLQSYTPTSEDIGFYLRFEVIPGAAGGNTPGTTLISIAVGPVTNTTMYTGEISSASDVDHWMIHLDSASDVIIDVQAFESCGRGKPIPSDFFNDGHYNNQLIANMYLFTSTSGTPGTLIGSSTGGYPADSSSPGPPGSHDTRSGRNPYLNISGLGAGDYLLSIGSYSLNEADARNGLNSDGSNWKDEDEYLDGKPLTNYYNILVRINPN